MKKHNTILNEPQEAPASPHLPEVEPPNDPMQPGLPTEAPDELPIELPPDETGDSPAHTGG